MLWPSTPAAPWLRATFGHAVARVVGRATLSIRLYHLPPSTPLPSADTMRSVQIDASVHHHASRRRASAPCLARSGTPEAACCAIPDSAPPTSCLPSFPRGGFATRPSPRPRPYRGNMKAVTPVDLTNRQVSPLTPLCRPGIPASTTQAARRSLCQSSQRRRLFPGFATERQARHSG